MRRKDREITDMNQIYEIMDNCNCCRLGFYDEGEVYIVPLNFGYEKENETTVLYFHSAKEGRKIDLIGKVESVGFEMDTDYKLNEGEIACSYSAQFKSLIGTGTISLIEDKIEKEKALQAIMLHNTKKSNWKFNDSMINSVCVFKVLVHKLTCKFHD